MKAPLATIAVALATLLAGAIGLEALDLQRPGIATIVTAHVVHLTRDHLAWSAIPTLMMMLLFERESGSRRALALFLLGSIAISAAVIFFEREKLESYCGLSGLGHAFAAAWIARSPRRRWLPAVLLFCKLGHELVTGAIVWDPGLDLAGGVPVPVAHATGAAVGGLFEAGRAATGLARLSPLRADPRCAPLQRRSSSCPSTGSKAMS